jgi:membrane-bound inhibitor of C-type lysozyme
MLLDTRVKVAGGVIAAVLSLLGAAQAHAATPTVMRYQCAPRLNLVVSRTDDTAVVGFIDRTYELRRKRSSIGTKYVSATAVLIIDGPSAVFVAEDRLQLGTCREAYPAPSLAEMAPAHAARHR